MAVTMEELLQAFGRLPSAQPVGLQPQVPMQQQMPPAPQQPRGLLGGFFGPDGRDARARLAMGLEGLTMNPNEAWMHALNQGIQTRAAQAEKNATIEWLKSHGREDLAAAMGAGLPAGEALRMAMTPKDVPQAEIRELSGRLVRVNPDGTVTEIYAAPGDAPSPQSAMAKLEADLRNGLITQDQYDIAMQNMAPPGFSIETGPDGQVRVVQGAGLTGIAGKPFTEAQSKDVVFATRAEGALAVLDPIAENLTSLSGRAANYDPTGIVRGRVQSPDFQVAQNAGNEFLQAILRKDTGAAITAQEQTLYGQTYLPQPGDGPDVLANKAAARRRAVEALKAGMSPAQIIAQEKALETTAPSGAAAFAAPQSPVQITSDAEYDALAPGTLFIGPDGKTRRKP